MKQKPKKVNFIGAMLARGQWQNMQPDEKDVLRGSGSGEFIYIAPVFDSGHPGETWQSLHLDLEITECRFEVTAAASDMDIRAELADPERDILEKTELILSLDGVMRENCSDMLLTDLCGRYYYMMVRIYSPGEGSFAFRGARMEFPKNTFLEYFPEIYRQQNDFFERYISIFQTMYLEVERDVDALVDRLDYEKARGTDLIELAEWAGLDRLWIREAMSSGEESRLRRLIAHTNEIQSGRGTAGTLKLLFDILYDRKIKILEYHQWHELLKEDQELMKLYEKLFGGKDWIAVFLDGSEEILSAEQRERMNAVICSALPMGMKARLICLEDGNHLDGYTYLDKNSQLSIPKGLLSDSSRLYGDLVLK